MKIEPQGMEEDSGRSRRPHTPPSFRAERGGDPESSLFLKALDSRFRGNDDGVRHWDF
jgi:hypothetical protein